MEATDFDEDYDSIPSTDAQIMSSIQDLMVNKKAKEDEEDFTTYKARMKDLLEQLLLKLEEDVDYQKNLELQIEELEQDLKAKDHDIERLSRQAKDAIDDCKSQANEMAQEMIAKLNQEMERNVQYKSLLLQLQSENFRLKSDLRIQQHADSSVHTNGATAYMTDLKTEVESLRIQLANAESAATAIKIQRDNELKVVFEVIKTWESRFIGLNKRLAAKEDVCHRQDQRHNCMGTGCAVDKDCDQFLPPPPPLSEECIDSGSDEDLDGSMAPIDNNNIANISTDSLYNSEQEQIEEEIADRIEFPVEITNEPLEQSNSITRTPVVYG